MCEKLTIHSVMRALRFPLPGLEAQLPMAPQPRVLPGDNGQDGEPRQGAVLLLLYPQEGRLFLLLTRRSEHVLHHKGQIALPGGAREAGDASLWQTALREAAEEVAIAPGEVYYVGMLSPLYVAASHFEVHPFIGYAPVRPVFSPSNYEVSALIEMPLCEILGSEARRKEVWVRNGIERWVPMYLWDDHVIWGATAMMLSELETLLRAEIKGCASPFPCS
ncbi:MAG: CoA pyrophosphatase [Chloroflexota bacterium]|nr:CoA pyrophosphatase [Chloroflexota bacterium]